MLKLPTILRKAAPAAPPVPRDRDGRFRACVDNAPVGIAFVGADGEWLHFNDRFGDVVGYTRDQLRRLTFADITHPEDARREATFLRKLRLGEVPRYRMEKRVVDKRGRERDVVVSATLVRDRSGTPEFFVFVVDDKPSAAVAAVEKPLPATMQERALLEQARASAEVRGQELRATIDQLRAELSHRDAALEEKQNELRIMANALRKEIERRKAAEEKLVEEKLPVLKPTTWAPLETSAAELLVSHGTPAHTGTLVIASGRREVEIFFEKGKVFSISSNDPSRFLAARLIALGVITEEQRRRALEIQRATHLALGRILTILGAVSEEQLVEVLRAKAEEEIAHVLRWRDVKYAFVQGEIPSLQLVPLRVDVTSLVVEKLNRDEGDLSHVAEEIEDEVEIEIPPPPPPHRAGTELLVASPVARKFHRVSCGAARRLDEETRIMFTSVDDAVNAGYSACRLCG